MSPRRSSRARTTQPLQAVPTHTNSSTSSVSSGRAERSTRSHNKLPSPNTANAPRSQSSEDAAEPTKPLPRRTRSGHEDIKAPVVVEPQDEDDDGEEEEITRCICGQIEYPGLPTATSDALRRAAKEHGNASTSTDFILEDTGGLFIQCDICKVWQHGGCVGILDESMSPEEYFCEQCRGDLHKLTTTPNGQKYSRYLPVQEETSTPASPDPSLRESMPRKGKDSKATRPNADPHKRRSTMNSRDAAYDESEQLVRAIEASKHEAVPNSETSGRRGKRSRSESEDRKEPIKRQRTSSNSQSPSFDKPKSNRASSSDEALATLKQSEHSPKKIRGAAARNHREKEQREQREKERADAAGRRKARSEKRRGDDSSPPSDPPTHNPTAPSSTHPPSPSPTIPPHPSPPPPKSHHKKTGRPPTKRGRVGRNQYSKDAPSHSRHASGLDAPPDDANRRGRSRSRSNADATNGSGDSPFVAEGGKPSKVRHMNPNRTSMGEMKRRVAGILGFVRRTEGEVEGGVNGVVNGVNGTNGAGAVVAHKAEVPSATGKEFASLSSAEMLKVLKASLVGWQEEFGS